MIIFIMIFLREGESQTCRCLRMQYQHKLLPSSLSNWTYQKARTILLESHKAHPSSNIPTFRKSCKPHLSARTFLTREHMAHPAATPPLSLFPLSASSSQLSSHRSTPTQMPGLQPSARHPTQFKRTREKEHPLFSATEEQASVGGHSSKRLMQRHKLGDPQLLF